MVATGAPSFSVVIATYNWSTALRIALESVRDQTVGDFEVLVVGDCCTDDSEAVVRSFGDDRLHWHNLAQNCGSQWGPNNFGLDLARGKYVAYLGHDDVWAPNHLAAALATFERTGAGVVAAATLLYGPPGSGMRAVTGFLPNGVFSPVTFFPPSSMLHTPAVAASIGGWNGPDRAKGAVDYDFLLRCHESGASIAMTGEFTVFKFNAAWRRDAYRRRDVIEQRQCLAALRTEGPLYLCRELTGTLRAATEDRLLRIEAPPHVVATDSALQNRRYKGSHHQSEANPPYAIDGPVCFPRGNENTVFEWHQLERHRSLVFFRWSGPSCHSVICLPVRVDQATDISVLVVVEIRPGLLRESSLSVNGKAMETSIETRGTGVFLWKAKVRPEQLPPDDRDEMRLTVSVPRTYRPIDLGINADRRWLGLAVAWVEVSQERA